MSASTSHASQLGLAALSRQLAEQQGCLLALTGKLQGVQDSTRRLNEFELQEAKVWQSRLAEAEEKAAEHFAKVEEEHGFKEAIHRAQQRVQMMKEVSSSHLYREWQRLFFAHHRSGGTLDNFSTVTFLREVCDVVPLSELAAKEAAAAELHEETSLLEIRLRNIEETELQAAAQAAEESAKGRMLRAELQEQQAVNAGWRSGRLQDSVYKLKLREEQDQHQGHAMELERQLKECEERTSTAAP
ncbi:unnamed protein product [Durusdinium trenchii]|uniref:Uncharacterized protein n=1 Tax=Durusdinium trenchii TaxID=1381693 RepID=A0ABP0HJS5_9DINO